MVDRICLLLFSLLVFSGVPAQTAWNLEKNSNGILVYSSDSGSARLKAVKVEADMKGPIRKFLDIVLDVDHHKNWVYAVTDSRLLKKNTANDLLYYALLDFSTFTHPRYAVIHMVVRQDTLHHTAEIITDGDTATIAEKPGWIRIPVFHARYDISEPVPGQLHVRYYSIADPGGSVPAWLSNMFVAKGPYHTFLRLAEQVQQ